MKSRASVLSLYRRILRAERSWQGPSEEIQYIQKERQSLFRSNISLTDPEEIRRKVAEGEDRLSIAVHYGIPYPRLHHAAPKIYKPVPVADDEEGTAKQSQRFSSNPAVNAKLQAAMERRLKQKSED